MLQLFQHFFVMDTPRYSAPDRLMTEFYAIDPHSPETQLAIFLKREDHLRHLLNELNRSFEEKLAQLATKQLIETLGKQHAK